MASVSIKPIFNTQLESAEYTLILFALNMLAGRTTQLEPTTDERKTVVLERKEKAAALHDTLVEQRRAYVDNMQRQFGGSTNKE